MPAVGLLLVALTCTGYGTWKKTGIYYFFYYYDYNKNSAQSVQGRFTASKDSSNLYLHINQMKTEDSVLLCNTDTVKAQIQAAVQKLIMRNEVDMQVTQAEHLVILTPHT